MDKTLSAIPRLKIGTLKLSDRFKGLRLGEGAVGVALWRWQEEKCDEIYVTVFEKQTTLIGILERFGFYCVGMNARGECVYLKSRKNINYRDPYKAFPFVSPNFLKAGLIPIQEHFQDKLFPYSELKGNKYEIEEETAGNGVTKVYIASPKSTIDYKVGEPVFIYRIYGGTAGGKTYRSAVTSYCVITKVDIIKSSGSAKVSLPEFVGKAGNKTVFTADELEDFFTSKNNVVMLEMTYNGFFGKGHNVNHKKLNDHGLFYTYPYHLEYSKPQFINILEMGDKDAQNVIID